MPVSAGTAYLDVVPRLSRDFSKQLSSQMVAPMARTADTTGTQTGRQLGTKLVAGMRSPLRQASGLIAGAFAVQKVVQFFGTAITQGRESNRVAAQTEAVIRSTGGAAKVTTKQVSDLATAISNKTGKDDEAIQAGANMILTFTGIRNAAGRNNDVFNQTVQVTEDMAAAMNGGVITSESMRQTSIQVGKALQDPIKGLTALRRVGVDFTDQQKAQITELVKSGHTLEAQKIILAELRREFGGSAAASATAADKLRVRWGNFQEAVGQKLIPIIDRASEALIRFSDATSGIGPTVVIVGAAIGGLAVLVLGTATKILMARDAWNAYKLAKLEQIGVDAAVGNAEVGLAAKSTGLAGKLGLIGAAAAAGAYQGSQFDSQLQQLHQHTNPLATALDKLFTITTIGGHKTEEATAATKEATAATGDNAEKSKQLAARLTAQAKAQADAKEKTDKYNQALKTERETIAGVIPEFDGYTSKSKLTAAQIVRNLRQEVGSYGTWSKDVQTLLHRGADPKFIAELSTKGPAYVHAMATGSDKELALAQRFFKERMRDIRALSATQLRLAGVEGAQGLAEGMDSKASKRLVDQHAAQLAQWVLFKTRRELGIKSPSVIMHGYGELLVRGLINGMVAQVPALGAAAAGVGASGAVALGKALAAQRGWVGGQWNALYQLWAHESGWRWNATNPTSGAYGIPQALPPGKMASAGADWRTNPRTQELWGMNYIAARYGTPANAWAAWLSRSPHWYGSGLWPTTFTRPTLIGVGERGPETVSVRPGYGAGGGNSYTINVAVPPTVNRADVGREVVQAIKAFEAGSGPGWRT